MKTLAQFIFESEVKPSEKTHFAEHGFKRVKDEKENDGSKTRRYEHPDGHYIKVYNYKATNQRLSYTKVAPYFISHVNGWNGGPLYNKYSKNHITAIKAFKKMDDFAAKETPQKNE
jgi:hypothetical protein